MNQSISFTLNGKKTSLTVDTDRKLLWVLRTDLGLTGTKYGCGENYCGACTVLLDGEAVRSCQVSVNEIRGKEVTTIEGLARNGTLHPIQQAFVNHDALQCGYCTPGMIMTAAAFLGKKPKASRDEIIRVLDDNLCRCAAHKRIVEAMEEAVGAAGG
ncbi:MAG TPA: (2Fe-2S)-binding protein [Bacteroidota bacterium]|nr:(2Fe-2S)-binding protein [Bacteroidota bacterium]